MTTKGDGSNQKPFDHFQTDNKDRYTNFNLNFQCQSLIPVQSSSKSYNDKNCDSVVSDIHKEKINSQTCNKSLDLCLNSLKLYDETEGRKPQNSWKTDKLSKNVSNKSHLTLHISAHENSIEAVTLFDDGFKGTKLNANIKQIFNAAATFVIGVIIDD
uniref:Uncharacterized protein n=1 Tax=Panagrolaimus sp. PS1159 TaxID=55785 RepID=A0AC35GJ95_9BILA